MVIGAVVAYLFTQMVITWLVYVKTKNPSVVDISWPLGLAASAWIYILYSHPNYRTMIIGVLVSAWAMRLILHLVITRIFHSVDDRRYKEISEKWQVSPIIGFFINYQFQGLLILIISSVFLCAANNSPQTLSKIDYLAIVIVCISIVGEGFADWQLKEFKEKQPGKVCNVKLWRYSRHPNYLFDWLAWCGFYLFALHSNIGLVAIISPLTLYLIFTKVTGPLTELSSIKSRGAAFIAYQKQTNFFFPGMVKKR